jgi:hypothetical protein
VSTAAIRVIARALRIRSAELHRDTPRVAQLSPAAEAAVQRIVANELAELAALIRDPPDKDRARAAGQLPGARFPPRCSTMTAQGRRASSGPGPLPCLRAGPESTEPGMCTKAAFPALDSVRVLVHWAGSPTSRS